MGTSISDYLFSNYIEILGFIFGIAYVILAIRESYWCWVAGIVNVTMYIFVFYSSGVYGMMALQVVYLVMSIYGLLLWTGLMKEHATERKLRISRLPKSRIWLPVVMIIAVTAISGFILSFTDNQIPYWDGLITAMGLIATWMAARKILESWLLWIVNDVICVAIYGFMGLYPTMVLYFIFAAMAVIGYRTWRKQMTPALP